MAFFKKKTTEATPETTEPSLAEKIGDSQIEKGMPDLDNPQGKSNMGKVGLFLGLLFATGLIAAGAIVFTGGDEEIATTNKPEMDMVQNNQSYNFNQDTSDIKGRESLELAVASEAVAASQPEAKPQEVPPIQTVEAQPQAQPAQETQVVQMVEREPPKEKPINPRLLGSVLVNSGGGLSADIGADNSGSLNTENQAENSPFMATSSQTNFADDDERKPQENAFANSLKPTQTLSVRAMQRGKMDYVLAKGTNILCTLDTQSPSASISALPRTTMVSAICALTIRIRRRRMSSMWTPFRRISAGSASHGEIGGSMPQTISSGCMNMQLS